MVDVMPVNMYAISIKNFNCTQRRINQVKMYEILYEAQ